MIKRDSVSLKVSLSYPCPGHLVCNLSRLWFEVFIHLFFFPFLFYRFLFFVFSDCSHVDIVLTGYCYNLSFFALFCVFFNVDELFHLHNPQCCWFLFLLLFLTHKICLCHLLRVRPYTSLFFIVFLSVWARPLSFLRIVENILPEGLPWRSFIGWDFCYRFWFREVFLFFQDARTFSFISVWQCLLSRFPSTCSFLFL